MLRNQTEAREITKKIVWRDVKELQVKDAFIFFDNEIFNLKTSHYKGNT